MKNKNYTPDGQHPEDVIIYVKNFINELSRVQENYFKKLVLDLKINKEGEDWLHDYIYNSGEEGEKLCFDEYLQECGKLYEEFIIKDAYYIPVDDVAELETDFLYSDKSEPSFVKDIL